MTMDYDAQNKIRRLKESVSKVESTGSSNSAAIRKLREEFDAIRRDQSKIIENQEKMTAAIERLATAVETMNNDIYPKTENTKPVLKRPAANDGHYASKP